MYNEYLNFFLLFLSFIVTIVTIGITSFRNIDIFSPVKVFLLFNIFFYIDIYFSKYDSIIVALYLSQCSILLVLSLIEPKRLNVKRMKFRCNHYNKVIISIWFFSTISILNQLYLIYDLGGIVPYVANIAYRVEYFKGKGYLSVLNTWMAIFNVIYFTYLLSKEGKKGKKYILFFLHSLFFVIIALISGSRSFLLMTFLVNIMIFNYHTNRVTYKKLILLGGVIVFLVGLLGTVRNSINTNDGYIQINESKEFKLDSTHFRYGLMPLEIIFAAKQKNKHYGLTYLSFFTNFIPRKILHNKPDTGGLVFTKEYTGDRWGGRSNLATGAITEGIMNFGDEVGVVFGLFSIGLFFFIGIVFYKQLINKKEPSCFELIIYVYVILSFSRYSYSDFSYLFFSLFVNIIIPLTLIKLISSIKV